MTYQEVAIEAGSPRAYRVVGSIMSKNYHPSIPCHRVIRSDGQVGNYNRGKSQKITLLKQEGASLLHITLSQSSQDILNTM